MGSREALPLALMALALSGAMFFSGFKIGELVERQDHLTAAVEASSHVTTQQERVGTAAISHAGRQAQADKHRMEINNAIPEIVSRDPYRLECVDPDGVRVLDQARAIANGTAVLTREGVAGAAGDTGGVSASASPAERMDERQPVHNQPQ